MLLDVLSMVPVVGTAVSAYQTYQSIKQGNYGEAALNLLGCIPGGGLIGKGLKFGVKGAKALKALSKGAKIFKKLKLLKGEKRANKFIKFAKKGIGVVTKALKAKKLRKLPNALKKLRGVMNKAAKSKLVKKGLKAAVKNNKYVKKAVKFAKNSKFTKPLKVVRSGLATVREAYDIKSTYDTAKNIKNNIKDIKKNGLSIARTANLIMDVIDFKNGIKSHGPSKPKGKHDKPYTSKKGEGPKLKKDKKNNKPKSLDAPLEKKHNTKDTKRDKGHEKNKCTDGDPINVATGAFDAASTDLVIEDRGLEIDIKRVYDSRDKSIGCMGRGWSFEYETRIERVDDEITLVYPHGHFEKFQKIDGIWENQSTKDKTNILIENEDGYILNIKNKTIYEYNLGGKLISISDTNNNKIKISYDDNGNISAMVSPGGKVLNFTYYLGKITEIEDNIGRKVTYKYEGDNLVQVRLPNEGILEYTYENNLIVEIKDQANHTYVKNEYDSKARVVKQWDREGNITDIEYDDKEMITTFIMRSSGVAKKYKYNRKNLVTERIYSDSTKTIWTYDEFDNKNSETDRNGNTKKWIYDENGNALEEIRPDKTSIKNEYDDKNNLIKTTTSWNEETIYNYDERNNLIEEIVKIDAGIFAKTSYTYDEYGRILTKTDTENNTTIYDYKEEHIDSPTKVTDPENNVFRYEYDKAGRMLSINTSYGTVAFGYNALNKKTHIIDAKGNVTRLLYDKMGNLIKRVLPNNYDYKSDNGIGDSYRYDAFDRLIRTIDPLDNVFAVKYDVHGNVIKEINPNYYDRGEDDGQGISYEYDEEDRKIKTVYPTGGISRTIYDPAGNVVKTIDPVNYNIKTDDGLGTEYSYDNMNRITMIKDPEGNVFKQFEYDKGGNLIKEIDAKGYATLYKYNTVGWLLEKRVPVEINEDNGQLLYNITSFIYDKLGQKIEEKKSPEYVDETGYPKTWNIISYSYDKNNRVIKISDSTGAEINYAYDCLNNRTLEKAKINDEHYKTTRYYYNSVGWLEKVAQEIEKTDLAEQKGLARAITLYEYDGNGNITKITSPEGNITNLEYDLSDRLVKIIEEDRENNESRITKFEYDSAGNLIKEIDCNKNSIQYEYDSLNRQIKVTDKEHKVTRLYYDENGNIIKHITPENYNKENDDGKGTIYSYDSLNRLTKIKNALGIVVKKNKYNSHGELIEEIDASNQGVQFTYDIGGRTKKILTPNAKQKGKASQEYTYDALGNITGLKDGEGNETKYILDLWGRITEITKADESKESYTYDFAGNVTSTTDGNGNTIEYTYNSFNLLSQIKDQAGEVETFKYDRLGRVSLHTDRNKNIVQYSYNRDNNILRKQELNTQIIEEYTYNLDGSLKSAKNENGVYTYEYTPNRNLKNKYLNNKLILQYTYNKDNKVDELKDLTGRTTKYTYDIMGRVENVFENNQQVAAYTYNHDDTINSIKYGNGISTQYSYDQDKNIIGILSKTKEGQELLNHSYKYNNNGYQTEKNEEGNITKYTYDSLSRLAKVNYPDYTEAFTYDKAGNRTKKIANNSETSYFYDARNRLKRTQEGTNFTFFEYDPQGNLLSERNKQGKTKYTYDCFNRTSSVYKSDGSYIKNFYDAEGLRSKIDENGVISKFIFSGRNIVTELDAQDNLKTAYIRGYNLISQSNVKGENFYYLNNAHNDVVSITDRVGNIVNSYTYDAFGTTLEAKEQIHNRFRYVGQQYDSVTSQYYLRARYYNPVVGRFTQEDVDRGDGLNLYAYVSNNPVNYEDPSGYSCEGKGNTYSKDLSSRGYKPKPGERSMTREQYKQQRHNERLERALGEKLKEANAELRNKIEKGEVKRSRGKEINTVGVGIHKDDITELFKGNKSVISEAVNGKRYNPLKEKEIQKKSQNIIDDFNRRNPDGSKEIWEIDNCAEFDLINKGFKRHKDAELSDMYAYVTDAKGLYKEPCRNCSDMYDGLNYFDGTKFNQIKISD